MESSRVIFLLLFAAFLHAIARADCQGRIDPEGLKQGPEKCLFDWGRVESFTFYSGGKKNGPRKVWLGGDGKLASEEFYKDDQLDGIARYYSSDYGTLAEERDYVNGRVSGLVRKFVDGGKDGKLESLETYLDDKRNGPALYFYANGRLKEEIYYQNDVRNGRYELYWEDGRRNEVAYYKDGHRDGEFWVYYPNGKLHSFGTYREGLMEGLVRSYLENGQEKSVRCYQNDQETDKLESCAGKADAAGPERIHMGYRNGSPAAEYVVAKGRRNGESKAFYEAGSAREISSFTDDWPDGLFKYLRPSGALEREVTFQRGEPDGIEKTYYENGSLAGEIEWAKGAKKVERIYLTAGKVAVEFRYGKLGGAKYFYPNGRARLEIATRAFPDLTGDAALKTFFDDGKPESEASLRDGARSGVVKEYFHSGKVRTRSLYRAGRLLTRESLDENGKTVASEDYTPDPEKKE